MTGLVSRSLQIDVISPGLRVGKRITSQFYRLSDIISAKQFSTLKYAWLIKPVVVTAFTFKVCSADNFFSLAGYSTVDD